MTKQCPACPLNQATESIASSMRLEQTDLNGGSPQAASASFCFTINGHLICIDIGPRPSRFMNSNPFGCYGVSIIIDGIEYYCTYCTALDVLTCGKEFVGYY